MRVVRSICVFIGVALAGHSVFAQRRVAITVDDLPYVADGSQKAKAVNRVLLEAFRRRHIPVTGFVIQKSVESLGPAGTEILRQWVRDGFDLANHSYSHPDFNELSIEEMEREILGGEMTIGPLMKAAGKRLEFFRFPMNHTGDTKEKHDGAAEFLKQHGYALATCTIENEDYLFNRAYGRMLADRGDKSAERLRREYLAQTGAEIDYFAGLNRQVLGYEPPEVMLLHDDRLNGDVIEAVLKEFEKRGYRFISLGEAQEDPAYRIPETLVTKFGWMWGYRWARERGVKVDGKLEPEAPKWITEYGEKKTSLRR